jgi:hypothetical protein
MTPRLTRRIGPAFLTMKETFRIARRMEAQTAPSSPRCPHNSEPAIVNDSAPFGDVIVPLADSTPSVAVP